MDDALPDFFDSQAGQHPKGTAAVDAKPEAKAKNGRRKKRTPRPEPVQQAAPAEPKPKKRGPKPGAKRVAKAARSPKIDLSIAFHALTGLSLDEAKIMSGITAGLQQVPKKSRARVVAALGKLFE